MCSTDKCLEIFTTSGIYQVFPPESLDPKEMNPDMPSMTKKVSDYGTQNWIVARVMVQNYKIVEYHAFLKEEEKALFARRLHDLMDSLLICSEAADYLTAKVDEVEKQVTLGEIKASGNVFENFPTTEGIEDKLTSFLTKAKHSIQRIIDIFNFFDDSKITNPRIDLLIDWCEKESTPPEIIEYLKYFEPLAKYLIDLRNSQEHPSKSKRFEFTDFTILPGNEISAPLWGINEPKSSIHKEMNALIREFVAFSEWLIIHLVLSKQEESPIFGYQVIEIPEEHRDPKCPIKYTIEICFKPKGEQGSGGNA